MSEHGFTRAILYGTLGILAVTIVVLSVMMATTPRAPGPGGSVTSDANLIGGEFALRDETGKEVTDKTLIGKPTIIFFGFTHCPEVCPTTLYEISILLKELGADADRINAYFVTVDPERDTSELMAKYLSSFDPHIHGLTGSLADIEKMAKAYRVYFKKVPLEEGGYTMDHTALVYLFAPDGAFVAPLNLKPDPAAAADKVRPLLSGN